MLDDWTSGTTKYRRGIVGSSGKPKDHNGASSLDIRDPKGEVLKRTVPEFDQGRVLADHLPAAAADVIIRSHDYIVKSIQSDQCLSQNNCIAVYRSSIDKGPYTLEQIWTITNTSGLPSVIKLRLPDVMRGTRTFWKTIAYSDYKNVNNVFVPATLNVSMPMGVAQTRTLVSIQPDVAFDTHNFDQEIGQ